MSILTLTDHNWDSEIQERAALVLLSNGDGVRSDFNVTFRKAADANRNILFAQVNPQQNPAIAARFNVGAKPVMVGLYRGETLVRRVKPWGSDVTLSIDMLENAIKNDPQQATQDSAKETQAMSDNANNIPTHVHDKAPVTVEDNTFQQEVIDYSHNVPVLVDFWAEWCGPCRMVAPILEKLSGEFAGQLRVAKVDVDSNPGLSQVFRIQSIPTIMAFKEGKLVFSQPGAFPEAAFRDLIQQLIDLEIPADEEANEEANTPQQS